ncbi:acetyl-CoA C-acyltransferase [Herbiconiux moechotypicola]|uniref:Probable acetyl-CoA acetyltransferase n=1 Tax=Herbiconiux moechotypicola TaxID=637393 RepID=A0ABP5QFX6_9MICO|nr:acetyl-CoA C-acyltransferase [Herbiconiux moechotypicola]MCS5730046.1 acetyl-CoA C-acyltransferase [Herbiconiux moechotypicola]
MSVVIAGYARTPFAKYCGRFAAVPATELGAAAIRAALDRAGVEPGDVDRVLAGQVLQAAAGQNPARQAAVAAGIPLTVPALTLNAVCLSGTEAIISGARLIEAGEADIVVAAGQESMSLAPHAWPGSRAGMRYGAIEFIDTLEHDGLTDAFERRSMGVSTEERNDGLSLSRHDQDAWAAASHARLAASAEFQRGEIAPFELAGRRGAVTTIDTDDGLRADTTIETLAALRPAFGSGGTITAGNSSQITDGAAAVVLMSERIAAERTDLTPLARIVATATVAGPDVTLHAQPAQAIAAALARAGRSAGELSAVEINEAFAAVAVHSTRLLGVDPEIVNRHGGAIALGHPIGASGTRIVGTLARILNQTGPRALGASGICGGGGQGAAVLLEAV